MAAFGRSRMQTLAELLSHPLLDQAVYSQYAPPYLKAIAASGAILRNAEFEAGNADKWWIEIQRPGADLVQAGVVRNDAEMIATGWKSLRWGLDRQDSDGGFGDTSGGVLSVAFFVEAVARALLVHKSFQRAPENADELASRLRRAAAYLRAELDRTNIKTLDACAHRWWLLAAAFAETDAVLGDGEFLASAPVCRGRAPSHDPGRHHQGGQRFRRALPSARITPRVHRAILARATEAVRRSRSTIYARALEALVLCAQLTGDHRLLLAAKAMEPYAARDVTRLRGATHRRLIPPWRLCLFAKAERRRSRR